MIAHEGVLLSLPTEREVADDIVQGLMAADPAILSLVYRRHHTAVRALARRLGMGDEAEDVVHDVFIALPTAISRFRGDSTLLAFLRGLTVNVAHHHRRSAARRSRLRDAVTRADRDTDGEQGGPLSPYEVRLLEQALCAVSKLPWDQRVAFVLCELEQLSASEAAAVVGAPEATVRTRLFHARKKLREIHRSLEGER
jgi:RNA polymerase sigma-70 factor (ECF subfamily)